MEKATVGLILLAVFSFGGGFLILLGLLIWRRLWDSGSVEAECVDLGEHTQVLGVGSDRTYMPRAKRPVYRYFYQGRQYTASPLLSSNRPGYRPKLGHCTIRIHPKHPEKVYSPERKFAALILIGVGSLWLAIAALTAAILPG